MKSNNSNHNQNSKQVQEIQTREAIRREPLMMRGNDNIKM